MINIYAKGLSIGIKDPFKNKTSIKVNLFTEDFCTEIMNLFFFSSTDSILQLFRNSFLLFQPVATMSS